MKGNKCEDSCVNNAFRNSKATETDGSRWYFLGALKHMKAIMVAKTCSSSDVQSLILLTHTVAFRVFTLILIHFHCKSSFSRSVTQTKVFPWLIKFSRWSQKAITDPLGEGTVEPRPLSDSAANKRLALQTKWIARLFSLSLSSLAEPLSLALCVHYTHTSLLETIMSQTFTGRTNAKVALLKKN